MPWLWLTLAALFEILWAVSLKYTDGFSRLWPTALTVCALLASLSLLALALRQIPLGTAYAVWSGLGAAGTALLGITLFGESAAAWRLVCIALILIGVTGLKVTAVH